MRPAQWAALLLVVVLLDMTGNASAASPLAPLSTPGIQTHDSGQVTAWQGPPGWSSATHSCLGMSQRPATGSLTQTNSAGPSQSSVLPGQKITVTLTWKPSEFLWSAPSKLADCVWFGPRLARSLSQVEGPGPTTGTSTFTYVVPADGTGGDAICSRGLAWGRDDQGTERELRPGASWVRPDNTEASAVSCYTVLSASAPEAPVALLFPLAGFALLGGGLLLARRRRARGPLDC